MTRLLIAALALIAVFPATVFPGEADVTGVEVRQTSLGCDATSYGRFPNATRSIYRDEHSASRSS